MKTTVEPLEGNKVKLSVEVGEVEFEKAIDTAVRRIAREIRIPGFRPGKAPRRLIEARIGSDAARQEALRDALPDYYAQAVKENDVDAIAPPKIDITAGEDSGAIAFDAVVEVRPRIDVPGYAGLQVTIPNPRVTEEEDDRQIARLRQSFGQLNTVERPAVDDDHVSIDITGTRDGEAVEGLTATDFLYEIGSGVVTPALDEHLRGTKAGDIVKFDTAVPGQEGDVTFSVLVKEVREKLLPDVTDEWASEASEFETVDDLRADLRKRLGGVKRIQANLALQNAVVSALVDLVDAEPPEALVGAELESRIHDLGHRLQHQGMELAQYLEATGTSQEELLAELREASINAVKGDLALRAIAESEGLEPGPEEITQQIDRIATQVGKTADDVRQTLESAGELPAVRSDLRKGKALEWLVHNCEVVDEEGSPIDRADLELETPNEGEPVEEAGDTE